MPPSTASCSVRASRRRRKRGRSARRWSRFRASLAKGCAKSPTRGFAPAWSRLARKLPLPAARRCFYRKATGSSHHSTGANEEMKARKILTCAIALTALAACNKNKSESGPATADNSQVTITQANPPQGGDWGDVVNATSAGYMMGNPNAKVKLVEFGSLFCPYCKNFEETGSPLLIRDYVKPGKV